MTKQKCLNGFFALVLLITHAADGQDTNGFRGYKTGRYEGDASNATSKGKVFFEIKTISRTGETKAHFSASGGLYGEAELIGQIDPSGVLRLTGPLSSYSMTVVARVTGNTIKADYRLTNSYSSQDGLFTAALTGEPNPRTAAPPTPGDLKGQACSYDVPAGAVSRSSLASEQLFKHVLYDWFNLDVRAGGTTNPLQVGVSYLQFEMQSPIRNRVVADGATGAQRAYDGAPAGATIYRIKTTYIHCGRFRGTTERRVTQQDFACFKDRFGDWTCPVDSVPVNLEKTSFPSR